MGTAMNVGAGVIWEIPMFSSPFYYKPKTTLKIVFKKKTRIGALRTTGNF